MSALDKTIMQFELQSLNDWDIVIAKLNLTPKTLLLLEGEMGAGKTTFVSRLCQSYGVELVASPTYAIIHQYQARNMQIQHVDLYRLESEDEIQSSGFWDLFENRDSIIIVEWPSRISENDWPLDWQIIKISIEKQNEKRLVKVHSLF